MLWESPDVRQIPGEGRRRWFQDRDFDLIVWYDPGGKVSGFQLCYDKRDEERALTWKRRGGFSHDAVDVGEQDALSAKRTPMLVADGVFDRDSVAERFRAAALEIDPDVARFVYETLLDFPG